jgi:prophage regulatory protein
MNIIRNRSILRRKQVESRTGLSRSTIYLRIKKGTFPKPIKLGERAVGWLEQEIDSWLDERVQHRDHDDVQKKALPGANWKGLCEVMNYNEY